MLRLCRPLQCPHPRHSSAAAASSRSNMHLVTQVGSPNMRLPGHLCFRTRRPRQCSAACSQPTPDAVQHPGHARLGAAPPPIAPPIRSWSTPSGRTLAAQPAQFLDTGPRIMFMDLPCMRGRASTDTSGTPSAASRSFTKRCSGQGTAWCTLGNHCCRPLELLAGALGQCMM